MLTIRINVLENFSLNFIYTYIHTTSSLVPASLETPLALILEDDFLDLGFVLKDALTGVFGFLHLN